MDAFILSGGGAKGSYEAGAIFGMAQSGLRPDILAGSSIGAMNAALLAARLHRGESLLEASSHLLKVWRGTDGIIKLDRFGLMKGLLLPKVPTRAIFRPRPLQDLLHREMGSLTLADFQETPKLFITGTDLQAGRTVLFGPEVSLVEAVLASGAYPIALPTVEINGKHYTDGGLFSNTPLKFAIRAGATRVFVIQLSPADYFEQIRSEKRFDSIIEVAPRCVDLLWSHVNYQDMEEVSLINEILEILELIGGQHYPGILELRSRLMALGRIEKEGRDPKRRVEIISIQPRNDLGGTWNFSRDNTDRLINQGISDAVKGLREISQARTLP